MIKISVVVPAYNEESYLRACLASLKKQNFNGDYEIIVVDNNSADKTAQIARDLGCKVVFEPQQGVCFARQRGVVEALGEIIVSTDADCVFPEDWLANIVQAFLENKNSVAVIGPYDYPAGSGSGNWFIKLWFKGVFFIYKVSKKTICAPGANFAFYKKNIEAIGGYNINLNLGGDEYDLLKRIRQGGKVVYLRENKIITSSRRLKNGFLYNFFISILFCYLIDYFSGGRLTKSFLGRLYPAIRKEINHKKILLEQVIMSSLLVVVSAYFLLFSASSPVSAKTKEGAAFVHKKIISADYQIERSGHKLKVFMTNESEKLKHK
ncbi:MAG: glycosyltransferase family A protein [Candidatus Gribaldobacteria bacterium]|nr:glycosyltransferase family A protein [Candidatus Gribaldobacteria bacterium]